MRAQLAFSIQTGQDPLLKEWHRPQWAGTSCINNLICLKQWISVYKIKLRVCSVNFYQGRLETPKTCQKFKASRVSPMLSFYQKQLHSNILTIWSLNHVCKEQSVLLNRSSGNKKTQMYGQKSKWELSKPIHFMKQHIPVSSGKLVVWTIPLSLVCQGSVSSQVQIVFLLR